MSRPLPVRCCLHQHGALSALQASLRSFITFLSDLISYFFSPGAPPITAAGPERLTGKAARGRRERPVVSEGRRSDTQTPNSRPCDVFLFLL